MTIPNAGPEHPDPNDPNALDAARRGNPPLALRGDRTTDDVQAASTRASALSHRFGTVRHALSRPPGPDDASTETEGDTDTDAEDTPDEGGESDPRD